MLFLQANGLDERFNQMLIGMLVKFTNEKEENLDEFLDTCVHVYNTSQHESMHFTPFEVMFGQKKDPEEKLNPKSDKLSNSALVRLTDRR